MTASESESPNWRERYEQAELSVVRGNVENERLRAALVASDAGMQTLRAQHAMACDERDALLAALPKCCHDGHALGTTMTSHEFFTTFACDDHKADRYEELPYASILRRIGSV